MASLMMNNKYEIDIPSETIHSTIKRLTNQLWKLIPMKENNEEWQKQLQTLIIEISGLNVIFDSLFLQLLSKLEGLNVSEDIDFGLYRKTVFECISLIQGIGKNVK